MIVEYFILASNTLFIILEYMYMPISATDADMHSIVTIPYVYISYSDKAQCHTVFNGSRFLYRLDESDTVIYLVELCEIDLPHCSHGVYTGVPG